MKNISIQSFGHLLIADKNWTIVAASETISCFNAKSSTTLIGSDLQSGIVAIFGRQHQLVETINEVSSGKTARQVIFITIDEVPYYTDVYLHGSLLYIEWEREISRYLLTSQMHTEGLLNDLPMEDILHSLCQSTKSLLGYDRVSVLQLTEMGHTRIVAEANNVEQNPMIDIRYSSSFIDQEDLNCFLSRAYRYFPDLMGKQQKLYNQQIKVDLSASTLEPIAEKFQFYLQQIGASSAIFFKLSLEGKLWGLLAASNSSMQEIDVQKRKLCQLIVQNATNRLESQFREAQVKSMEILKGAENFYKTALIDSSTLNKALLENLPAIQHNPRADGLALYFHGQLFTQGLCPDDDTIEKIVQYVATKTNKSIFKDSNFRLRHQDSFQEDLNFAGLATLEIARNNEHYLLWFRKETKSKEVKIKESKSIAQQDEPISTKYRIIEETVFDTAIAWDGNDLAFIEALDKTINEAVLSRNKEQNRSLEELTLLNNELEMLTSTLSHDLKNPLAIVKMGVQYLRAKEELPREAQLKWLDSISTGVMDLESLVENTVKIGKERNRVYAKDSVAMSALIKKLANDAKLLYGNPQCKFSFGELHSICGDKGILHQVFMNLIGNAVKYSRNAASPSVSICSHRQVDHVTYIIKDNGIGIPKKDMPQIFKIYRRASNAHEFNGSGIGLSLVKRLVENLSGTIQVSSIEGEGTEFTLQFPINCS
ncbi:ATP-binding protein [Sphingobacterium oryzagri]|uniref:histidine kinase n=1 Tax=Sphingobacterium oryzagri TaxID=3025669 RepID=A0ABY7WCJ3_9SPHI|nr:ATP-binding protein [Sphingobacterium sp. KACC 22765]WDF66923.1 ATP-binding protein [Sphingobacterium sp. KACC 22765]